MSVSATEESSEQSLPSFTTLASELDPSSWDYYDHRVVDRNDVISAQHPGNYTRPWEMESKGGSADGRAFEPYAKLPSFQSQFQPFQDPNLNVPEPSLPQAVPVPISPSSASSIGGGQLTQLTQLTTSPLPSMHHQMAPLPPHTTTFHTLTAVSSPRSYPLVPAPIQARDIPTIQQQYLDERHIQIYQPISTFPQQSVVTVLKNEPANFDISGKNGIFQAPITPMLESPHPTNGYGSIEKLMKTDSPISTPIRHKKERRKMRAGSLESGTDESIMDTVENHQVAAVSSTQASFKNPLGSGVMDDGTESGEKQTKKKRKRCGECVGCQKKDNCGDCAPCRNDKSHQICKQRRCEKLTEKKIIYGPDGTIIRGEGSGRGRGRGKGRGGGSGRGRKSAANSVISPKAVITQQNPSSSSISPAPATAVPHSTPSPAQSLVVSSNCNSQLSVSSSGNTIQLQSQQTHQSQQQQQQIQTTPSQNQNQIQQQQQQANHLQQATIMKDQTQQPMTPMAFYPTWQDPSQGWQNQFIQQIPQNTPTIAPLNSIEFQPQSYAYQPTSSYVQTGIGFDPNYGRTYATPVQRYEFQANQLPLTNQVQTVSFAPTVTYAGQVATAPALLLSQNSGISDSASASQKQQQQSGNDMPGYPRVNNVPPRSLNCNGYPGSNEYGGSISHQPQLGLSHSPSRSSQGPPSRPASSSYIQNSSPSSYSSPNGNTSSFSNDNHQSPHHTQSEWAWQQSAGGLQQSGDVFNQSDRVNLNTRLKTMILNKTDASLSGEESKLNDSTTGHFLSYSHHLRTEDSSPCLSSSNENHSEDFGRGGAPWKPSGYPEDYQSCNTSKKKDFEHKHQMGEKKSDDEKAAPEKPKGPKLKRESEQHAGSFDFGDVRNVKQETPVYRGEDYEKNYQSFIKFNENCGEQQGSDTKPAISQASPYSYPPYNYSSAGFQPYPPSYSTGYTNLTPNSVPSSYYSPSTQDTTPSPAIIMSNNSAFIPPSNAAANTSTNFEQQIPAHTYSKEAIGEGDSKKEPKREKEPFRESEMLAETKVKEENDEVVKTKDSSSSSQKKAKVKKEKVTEEKPEKKPEPPKPTKKEKAERSIKPEIPACECFKDEKSPAEPGSYYTHLGCAASLSDLRKEIELRCGVTGKQLRIEKVIYTGKEGKSSQGCPVAKWVIRRVDPEEKLLYIVKHRKGHKCNATYLVLSIVVWDGVPPHEADNMYRMLCHKLNKFGLPTTRRCATNESRTCACQGLDPETCGVSYSFGCSWSMYYNGCKYARSKTVRKFRLSVKSEEAEIEERMNILATILSPIYATVAPRSYENQVKFERDAYDCRLGLKTGKPFSGVTCCLDFCAHTHRDLHNMQDGCTVQAVLLKPRPYGVPPDDEQLHVLPMYIMDTTDEFDDEEGQKKKNETGACKLLEKFSTEVRVRSTPLQPCRRHGKKRNNGKEPDDTIEEAPPPTPAPVTTSAKKDSKKSKKSSTAKTAAQTPSPAARAATPNAPNTNSSGTSAFSVPPGVVPQASPGLGQTLVKPNQPPNSLVDMASMIDNFTDAQLQSNQISSTVLDSPFTAYDYNLGSYVDTRTYYNQWPDYRPNPYNQNDPRTRTTEEIPDTTTRPGSNSSTSAFSPSIPESKTPTNFTSLEDFKPSYGDRGFLKPKPPEYNAYSSAYGYAPHHNTYPSYAHYDSPYNSYNPYNYQASYHQTPYNIYNQTPPGPMPPPGPTSVPTPPNWNLYPTTSAAVAPVMKPPEPPKESLGEVTEVNDNKDCFEESQMGGVAIALQHGSLVIECAKLEMHSTTALKNPNRLNPTRLTLIFYQHRNLNRRAHGTAEWAEKMRLKKLGLSTVDEEDEVLGDEDIKDEPLDEFEEEMETAYSSKKAQKLENKVVKNNSHNNYHHNGRSPTCLTRTTTSWTTQFPMHPCVVTGPFTDPPVDSLALPPVPPPP